MMIVNCFQIKFKGHVPGIPIICNGMLMRMFTSRTTTMHVGLSEWPGLEARAVFTNTTGQASTNTTILIPLRLR